MIFSSAAESSSQLKKECGGSVLVSNVSMHVYLQESLVNLRTKVCDALDGAVENLDVEKMFGIEENERCRLNRSTLEALQFAFNAVFDVSSGA